MTNEYYYVKDGNRFGPFSIDELKELNINATTMVWCKGMQKWSKASEVEELKHLFLKEKTPPPIPSTPPPIPAQLQYKVALAQQMAYLKSISQAKTEQTPVKNTPPKSFLIEAILSTLFCVCPLGIIAIIYSRRVTTNIENGELDKARLNSNKTEKILEWNIYLFVIIAIIFMIYYVFSLLLPEIGKN